MFAMHAASQDGAPLGGAAATCGCCTGGGVGAMADGWLLQPHAIAMVSCGGQPALAGGAPSSGIEPTAKAAVTTATIDLLIRSFRSLPEVPGRVEGPYRCVVASGPGFASPRCRGRLNGFSISGRDERRAQNVFRATRDCHGPRWRSRPHRDPPILIC
jgi:hypothetical protein